MIMIQYMGSVNFNVCYVSMTAIPMAKITDHILIFKCVVTSDGFEKEGVFNNLKKVNRVFNFKVMFRIRLHPYLV